MRCSAIAARQRAGTVRGSAVLPCTVRELTPLGARQASLFHDGRLDAWVWGKSPPLGIAALATGIRDRLYNSGAGREYPWT